jgi:4'-phosphopantetheinyl transferase
LEQWHIPERFPTLAAHEVHVWRIELEVPVTDLDFYAALLAADECARRDRYRFELLQKRFVARRGAMRAILAAYLDAAPAALVFEDGGYGRPVLGGSLAGMLSFNLSDSGDLALLAVCRRYRVGVDVELIRPDIAALEIAERFFSHLERAALAAVPMDRTIPAFYRCWTRKEAYLKGTGAGIAAGLTHCSVSLEEGGPGLLHVDGKPEVPGRWLLRSLPIDPGYEAALAVEQCDATVRLWHWQPKNIAYNSGDHPVPGGRQ